MIVKQIIKKMSFKGEWTNYCLYQKSDIVYIPVYEYSRGIRTQVGVDYFICAIEHQSCDLVYPSNPEEIHWCKVVDEFIRLLYIQPKVQDTLHSSGILFASSSSSVPQEPGEPLELVSEEELRMKQKKKVVKRKIACIEKELIEYRKSKKQNNTLDLSLGERLLLANVDLETKTFLVSKYESIKKNTGSDYAKGINWVKTVLSIPFKKYRPFPVKASDPKKKINGFFEDVRSKLDDRIHNLDYVKDEIMEYLARKITNPKSKGHVLALQGSAGVGKCFSVNTGILMYDGSIKMVQNIQVGELIMGDDSTPRKVLTLGGGRDIMYKITNVKGEYYTVNSEHILCLKYSNNKRIREDKKTQRYRVSWFDNKDIKICSKSFYYNKMDKNKAFEEAKKYLNSINEEKICEISVKEYLKLSKTMKKDLKGYSVSVDFEETPVDFDPYIIGLWLGDGNTKDSGITSQDSSIIHYLKNNLQKYNCYLQYHDNRINGQKNKGCLDGNNKFLNTLKKYNLINNKHIPHVYKCNSRENRLKLLAGLLDSDGNLIWHKSGYEFTQSHEQIIDDTIYLCKSLGFSCYKKTTWTYKKYKKAWRVCISGKGVEEIPVLCPRKKSNQRNQIKDVLVSGISVEELKEDDYYGFMIDGNERFVLGNFIVTHNTKLIATLGEALNLPFYQINMGGLNDVSVLTGHSETYVSAKPGKIVEILGNAGCMNPIIYLDEIDKISEYKGKEINGLLTHLLDEEQNDKFQDNYLSNVNIDLSKVLFVIAFNDISKVDPIVLDRMKVINIKNPSIDDKLVIARKKIIPAFLNLIEPLKGLEISDELLLYIIKEKVPNEDGVRQIKKCLEKLMNKLNYLLLIGKISEKKITKEFIDEAISSVNENTSLNMMYV
jgi:hypothetical protein